MLDGVNNSNDSMRHIGHFKKKCNIIRLKGHIGTKIY